MPTPSSDVPSPTARLGHSEPVRQVDATQWVGPTATAHRETVVEEVPVALVYNEIPHAVVMATPLDLDDLALGFSLTEDLVHAASDVLAVESVRFSQGIELKIRVDPACQENIERRARRMTARTGCGLCGAEGIDAVLRPVRPVAGLASVRPEAVNRAVAGLRDRQPLNAQSGAVHAAGWAAADGRIELVREDVGRHNALDKLIGACARAAVDPARGFVVVTSRASFEMVQKTMILGAGVLVAMSGPTGLAVSLAEAAGIGLIGFARDGRFTAYAGPRRIA
ncbi:MAG: formate dehydrogenase accessory sulfurtransferase FdhD [Gemmatimonadetes bacterium]|nr:formate dehydrogenase accessory sulfurtransferase FdhD [Gemmatimonadota bacterium]